MQAGGYSALGSFGEAVVFSGRMEARSMHRLRHGFGLDIGTRQRTLGGRAIRAVLKGSHSQVFVSTPRWRQTHTGNTSGLAHGAEERQVPSNARSWMPFRDRSQI